MSDTMIERLKHQFTANTRITDGLVGTYTATGTVSTPQGLFPNFAAAQDEVVGFTVEVWLRGAISASSAHLAVLATVSGRQRCQTHDTHASCGHAHGV